MSLRIHQTIKIVNSADSVSDSSDNLGDHIATNSLNMNNNSITGINIGTITNPSIKFSNGDGIYHTLSSIRMVIDGTDVVQISSSGIETGGITVTNAGTAISPAVRIDLTTGLYKDGSDLVVAVANTEVAKFTTVTTQIPTITVTNTVSTFSSPAIELGIGSNTGLYHTSTSVGVAISGSSKLVVNNIQTIFTDPIYVTDTGTVSNPSYQIGTGGFGLFRDVNDLVVSIGGTETIRFSNSGGDTTIYGSGQTTFTGTVSSLQKDLIIIAPENTVGIGSTLILTGGTGLTESGDIVMSTVSNINDIGGDITVDSFGDLLLFTKNRFLDGGTVNIGNINITTGTPTGTSIGNAGNINIIAKPSNNGGTSATITITVGINGITIDESGRITSTVTNYNNLVNSDNVIVNKKYVDANTFQIVDGTAIAPGIEFPSGSGLFRNIDGSIGVTDSTAEYLRFAPTVINNPIDGSALLLSTTGGVSVSGAITISTGTSNSAIATGAIVIKTANAVNESSGSLSLSTGNASGTTKKAGDISIIAGVATNVAGGGNVTISASNGNGAGTGGILTLSSNLGVTDLKVLANGLITTSTSSYETLMSGVGNALASKAYVDAVAAGLDPKESVNYATTPADGNQNLAITLNGVIIDSVAVSIGQRVLIKNQTNAVENGIYDVNIGVATRSSDFNEFISIGARMLVISGTVNAGSAWVLTTESPITGVTNMNFVQYGGSSGGTLTEIIDTVFFINNIDNTKKLQFNLSGIGNTTTRQMVAYNHDAEFVHTFGQSYFANGRTQTGNPTNCTFFGFGTSAVGSTGTDNTFFGNSAGAIITNTTHNTFIGSNAGSGATGSNGTFIGESAGATSTGNDCTIIGRGSNITGGKLLSVVIGSSSIANASSSIVLGSGVTGSTINNSFTIPDNTIAIVEHIDNMMVGFKSNGQIGPSRDVRITTTQNLTVMQTGPTTGSFIYSPTTDKLHTTNSSGVTTDLIATTGALLPCVTIATANMVTTTINAGDVVNGITLVEGDRILLNVQTAGSQNGIYVTAAISQTSSRSLDFNSPDKIHVGQTIVVNSGVGAGDYRVLIAPTTIDSSQISISPIVTADSTLHGAIAPVFVVSRSNIVNILTVAPGTTMGRFNEPVQEGTRFLAVGQTNMAENGIYLVGLLSSARAPDHNSVSQMATGQTVMTDTDGQWKLGWAPVIIDTDPIEWVQLSSIETDINRIVTTDDTPTVIYTLNRGDGVLRICYNVMAAQGSGIAEIKVVDTKITVIVDPNTLVATIVGAPTIDVTETAGMSTVSVVNTIDGGNQFAIQVTGLAATSIRWQITLQLDEMI